MLVVAVGEKPVVRLLSLSMNELQPKKISMIYYRNFTGEGKSVPRKSLKTTSRFNLLEVE